MDRNIFKLPVGSVVHCVGVGGTGMSGLAKFIAAFGYKVTGSDQNMSSALAELEALGIRTFVGHCASNISPETRLMIVSAAIKENNPEYVFAVANGIKIEKYAVALGELTRHYSTVAVAGCHGKTTTTAMIAHVLKFAGRSPSYVIGGNVPDLGGNSGVGEGHHMVVEACEYDRSFLNLRPRVEVITNIEADHLDYYSGIEEIVDAFGDFVQLLSSDGYLLVCADSHDAVKAARRTRSNVETYGLLNKNSVWVPDHIHLRDGMRSFEAVRGGHFVGNFTLRLPGFHNVANALAAIAVGHALGLHKGEIRDALASFRGVERRMQTVGSFAGMTVIDDYGHHPTELKAVFQALREFYPGKAIWCVFQPHQHSRLRMFMEGFVEALREVDHAILAPVFYARDSKEETLRTSSAELARLVNETGGSASAPGDFGQISEYLRMISGKRPAEFMKGAKDAVMVTMGAGDVWEIGYGLCGVGSSAGAVAVPGKGIGAPNS